MRNCKAQNFEYSKNSCAFFNNVMAWCGVQVWGEVAVPQLHRCCRWKAPGPTTPSSIWLPLLQLQEDPFNCVDGGCRTRLRVPLCRRGNKRPRIRWRSVEQMFTTTVFGRQNFICPASKASSIRKNGDAFALKSYLLKPYPQKQLTLDRRIYNYRWVFCNNLAEYIYVNLVYIIISILHIIMYT